MCHLWSINKTKSSIPPLKYRSHTSKNLFLLKNTEVKKSLWNPGWLVQGLEAVFKYENKINKDLKFINKKNSCLSLIRSQLVHLRRYYISWIFIQE